MNQASNTAMQTVEIINKLGLHARAAARLVKCANEYEAKVTITKDGNTVSGKSMMGLMMLAAGKGSEITIAAEGDDAQAAVDGVAALIADRFGEEA